MQKARLLTRDDFEIVWVVSTQGAKPWDLQSRIGIIGKPNVYGGLEVYQGAPAEIEEKQPA